MNDVRIPEINPDCTECNGEGVVFYNYWGEATNKDDEDFLSPDVKEEPCSKCERSILA